MAIGGQSLTGSTNSATSTSQTLGTEASNRATQAAATANSAANAAWERAAAYNAEQARLNREWQERMANTVYQRTVADMKAAGINPILAAGMGLGTAGATSGATASMGNPMSYMANTYADSMSASQSQGSSWGESMSGLAFLADAITGLIGTASSTNKITIALEGLTDLIGYGNPNTTTGDGSTLGDHAAKGDYSKPITQIVSDQIGDWIKKPKEFIKDLGAYITMKNSGGMLSNYKNE